MKLKLLRVSLIVGEASAVDLTVKHRLFVWIPILLNHDFIDFLAYDIDRILRMNWIFVLFEEFDSWERLLFVEFHVEIVLFSNVIEIVVVLFNGSVGPNPLFLDCAKNVKEFIKVLSHLLIENRSHFLDAQLLKHGIEILVGARVRFLPSADFVG